MPRRYNIRWRPVDEEKLQRVVRNYNAKRRRLINIDPSQEEILPGRLILKEVRSSIGTRRDFNNTINRIQRFSRRGSEQVINVQGTEITKYEYAELKRSIRRLNNIRTAEREALESMALKSRGEEVGYTVGMGDITIRSLRNRQLNLRNKSRRELEHYLDFIELQSTDKYYIEKARNYKKNYLDAFSKEFSGMPFFEEFYYQLQQIPPEIFTEVLYTDTEGGIDFVYDEIERMSRYEQLAGVWSDYLNIDNILDYYSVE